MNIIDIINKKRLGRELTKEEIDFFIKGMLNKTIPDYQISALLMAIVLKDMTDEETINLTDAMIKSGEIINLRKVDGIIVDKHSTGGVGDKVTLVLAPLLASLGVKVAKMSGRGLGHTGGTIDKLEAIEGFNVELSLDKFIKQVNKIGVALSSQSADLDPADKKLYALRDVTGTVESIPLIASSVMSKKIASGADVIMIDVTVGNGALIKDMKSARRLSKLMIKIGRRYKKVVLCILTSMDQPLGYAIGNSLEVEEAIQTLQGNGPKDLLEVVMTFSSIIVGAIKKIPNSEAKSLIFKQLNNGEAYNKLKELVKVQGGNIDSVKVSDKVFLVKSNKTGYINKINTTELGNIAKKLGAGRETLDDVIDPSVGLVLCKKLGEYVEAEEDIAKIYMNKKDITLKEVLDCFEIGEELTVNPREILDIIR